MRESEFTARVCAGLVDAGAKVYVLPGVSTSSGLPDRMVIHRYWHGLLEFKSIEGAAKGNQIIAMRDCLLRGFPAYMVRMESPAYGVVLQVPLTIGGDPFVRGGFRLDTGLLPLLVGLEIAG